MKFMHLLQIDEKICQSYGRSGISERYIVHDFMKTTRNATSASKRWFEGFLIRHAGTIVQRRSVI